MEAAREIEDQANEVKELMKQGVKRKCAAEISHASVYKHPENILMFRCIFKGDWSNNPQVV